MRLKLINIGLLIGFLIGYLEWGQGNTAFIFEVEYDLLFRKANILESITHPVIIFGLTGQIFLLISVFRRNRWINLIGLLMLGAVMLLILLGGLLTLSIPTILSAIPFLFCAVMYFITLRRMKKVPNS